MLEFSGFFVVFPTVVGNVGIYGVFFVLRPGAEGVVVSKTSRNVGMLELSGFFVVFPTVVGNVGIYGVLSLF